MTKMLNKLAKHPIPRKLNQGMITALSTAIANGNYATTACQLCGIEDTTLAYWLDYAKEDLKEGVDSIYTALYLSLKRAEAEAEASLVEVVREAGTVKREWLPAMTFLERRHPDRWGRRERHDVNISEAKVIQIVREEVVIPGEIVEGEARELLEEGKDA